MINQVEIIRKQVEDLKSQLSSEASGLDQTLINFEENLYQLRLTGGQDGMRWPAKLTAKLTHIASELQEGDFPPTAQQVAVNRQFTEQIRALKGQFDQLLNREVTEFNKTLQERNLPALNTSLPRGGRQ
jgi:hypothetical protein